MAQNYWMKKGQQKIHTDISKGDVTEHNPETIKICLIKWHSSEGRKDLLLIY